VPRAASTVAASPTQKRLRITYIAKMIGQDSSAIWRFFTRGPGLFYTWPFFPLFKYLPILFGSYPHSAPMRTHTRQPKPIEGQPRKSKLRRLLRMRNLLGVARFLRPPLSLGKVRVFRKRHHTARPNSVHRTIGRGADIPTPREAPAPRQKALVRDMLPEKAHSVHRTTGRGTDIPTPREAAAPRQKALVRDMLPEKPRNPARVFEPPMPEWTPATPSLDRKRKRRRDRSRSR
jgi:hypothetical protein